MSSKGIVLLLPFFFDDFSEKKKQFYAIMLKFNNYFSPFIIILDRIVANMSYDCHQLECCMEKNISVEMTVESHYLKFPHKCSPSEKFLQ